MKLAFALLCLHLAARALDRRRARRRSLGLRWGHDALAEITGGKRHG